MLKDSVIKVKEALSGTDRILPILFATALAFRVAVALWMWLSHGQDVSVFLFGDSTRYLAVANNLLAGHGYSSAFEAPFAPDNYRTPGYPLFLLPWLAAFGSYMPAVAIQLALGAMAPVLTFLIGLRLKLSRRVSLFAAWFGALFPATAIWTASVITEPLFTFLFLAGLLVFLIWLERPRSWRLAAALAALWALAGLVRPVMELPLATALVVIAVVARKDLKAVLPRAALALAVYAAIMSPWIVWNRIQFGRWQSTSLVWMNVQMTYASGIKAIREGLPWEDAQVAVESSLQSEYGLTEDLRRQPASQDLLRILAIRDIAGAPRESAMILAGALTAFATHDSTADLLRRYGALPPVESGVSGTLVLLEKGPAGIGDIIAKHGVWLAIPLLMRIFWALMLIGMAVSLARLLSRRTEARAGRLFAALMFVEMAAMASTIALGIEARHRYPVEPLYLLLGAAGIASISAAIRPKIARIWNRSKS